MAIIPSTDFNTVANPLLVADDKVLLSSNLILFDDVLVSNVAATGAITLSIKDVDGVEQLLLTTLTIPAIQYDGTNIFYYVEDVEITGFPDGQITLDWSAVVGSQVVTHSQVLQFANAPSLIFVSGESQYESDYVFQVNREKRVHHRFKNRLGDVTDPVSDSARLVVTDTADGTTKQTEAATKEAAGLYYVDLTLASATYETSKDRYQIHWEGDVGAGVFADSVNSYVPIEIHPENYDYVSDGLTYSTNQDIRNLFPNIDEFLSQHSLSVPERELILNQRRAEAHAVIKTMYGNHLNVERELLRSIEGYMAIKSVMVSATAFSRLPSEYLDMFRSKIQQLDKVIHGKRGVVYTVMA